MTKRNKAYFNIRTSELRADGTVGGVRFNKHDKPKESVFKDLWDSIPFFKESSSRAKISDGKDIGEEQGIVVLANNAQAKSNIEQLGDRSLVTQPHQLPTVSNGEQLIGDYSTPTDLKSAFNVTVSTGIQTRNDFSVKFKDEFVSWLTANLGSGLNWDNDLIDSTPVEGVPGNGYTAEGGLVSKLVLPSISSPTPPKAGDKIGVSANDTSAVEISSNGSIFSVVGSNQSYIFRWDVSLSAWLIESSHTPFIQTSSTTIYVDAFATAGGDGSITLPYNNILSARNTVIGNGTAYAPQIQGATIIVVAGNFTVADENLFIEGCIYKFEVGTINHTGNGYLFDNSGVTSTSSVCTVIGNLNYVTDNPNSGFCKAMGNTGKGDNGLRRLINLEFNTAINTYPHNETVSIIPMVVVSCYADGDGNGKNNSQDCLILKGTSITGYNAPVLINYGREARVVHECGVFLRGWDAHQDMHLRSRLLIVMNNVNRITFNNSTFNNSQGSAFMKLLNPTQEIKFTNCLFSIYAGSNNFYKPNSIIILDESFVTADRQNSRSSSGLYFIQCKTTSNNYTTSFNPNPEARNRYFMYKVDSSNVEVSFNVDLDNCDLDGMISTFQVGFDTGSIAVYRPFRSNVLGYLDGSVLKKTLMYFNIPTSSSNLPTNSIWNDSGTLKIT